MMRLLFTIVTIFSFQTIFAQHNLTLGVNGSFNNVNYSVVSTNVSTQYNTEALNNTGAHLSIGYIQPISKKLFFEESLAVYDHVKTATDFEGYRYQYSFASSSTSMNYLLNEGMYIGLGVPLSYVYRAIQSTDLGSLDLIEEGNAPALLFGYLFKLGYRYSINDKVALYADLGRGAYLNSLDNDSNQELKASNYVLSFKAAVLL